MKRLMAYPLLLVLCIGVSAGAQERGPQWEADAQIAILNAKITNQDDAIETFRRGNGKGTFIVHLWPPPSFSYDEPLFNEEQKHKRRMQVDSVRDQALSNMPAFPRRAVQFLYDNFFAFSVVVSPAELELLIDSPHVRYIEPDQPLEYSLAQGIPLIRGDVFRSRYNGQGLSVAVCDSGIDYNNSYLGGGLFPNSKVIGGYDFGNNDGDPIDRQGHGTACAGILAGTQGTYNDYIGGVAYGAKLYALKIGPDNEGPQLTAAVKAWDWCVTHQHDNPYYPIMIISNSWSGGGFSDICDSAASDYSAFAISAQNAKAAGITILASSGNFGYTDAIGFPACISNVISVGQVYDSGSAADTVVGSSNSATILDLLAPGYRAYTLWLGPSGFKPDFSGTSAAAPYAAGAAAVLQSAALSRLGYFLTPDQVKYLLANTGNPITDAKNGITKPRVNLAAAIRALPSNSQANLGPIISLLLSGDESLPPTNTIQNGDFELGHSAWSEYSEHGYEVITTTFPSGVTPHSGSYAVWLGGVYDDTKYIRQSVAVPAASPYLTWYHWIASADICGYDFGYVRVNGTTITTLNLCSSYNTNGWVPRSINLSSYSGQTVSLEFRSDTDATNNSNWFVDDVSFRSSALTASDFSTATSSDRSVSSAAIQTKGR